jgi:hypothetical protein
MSTFNFRTQEIHNAWETETDEVTLRTIIQLQIEKGGPDAIVNLAKHLFQNGYTKGKLAVQSKMIDALGIRGVQIGR